MRRLFVGVLAAILTGCSCFLAPDSGAESCTGADGTAFACVDRNNPVGRLRQATESDPVSVKNDEAYVVDGSPTFSSIEAHLSICNYSS
jgi:hypothetical protein